MDHTSLPPLDHKQPHHELQPPPQSNSTWLNRKTLSILVAFILYISIYRPKFPSSHDVQNNLENSNLPLEFFDLSSLSGFFIQDEYHRDPRGFRIYHPKSSFGLIDHRSPDRWIRFKQQIELLSKNSPRHVKHKVIFIARHGQGFHNLAESKYGTPMWDCYWSEKTTDGKLVWGPDARLSSLGKAEARVAEQAWTRELANHVPLPEIFISSPLSRAIETMLITGVWKHATNHSDHTNQPHPQIVVTENLRENIGLHTCDRRRSKQSISIDFPVVEFENGFNDQDLLWTKDFQETDKQLDIRIKAALTRIFLDSKTSNLTYISITAHSGVISSLLRVLGHRPWPTETGGMIPLVVRATPKKTPTRPPNPGPSATKPACPVSF
ncbi:hypothetical protein PTTG_26809 [Puccinia triticina 1-1 BBBD Race 1]|uniref:Phosphoglycerate mutase n=2 Tax=Puccinia triticina TaxID=208348 RepID=A0A180GRA5_PUCT1|nr:uncharacterized protein PtA15_14A101 [Puccinia triticina]OAV94919.1 hypothetical protein PTTG_26809 [Puccinia triticina 1-1 BBBD Race 1]WAQ91219.1 hypothetical protein PtA15_14A101 [Puccinia triticina]WAR62020.1 hypothetical protein PtB15_14B114 [Puccinia triticina]